MESRARLRFSGYEMNMMMMRRDDKRERFTNYDCICMYDDMYMATKGGCAFAGVYGHARAIGKNIHRFRLR